MTERLKVAILDDWLGVVDSLIDWSPVRAVADLSICTAPIAPPDAAGRLAGFDVLCLTRDRMALPAALLEALPRLKLIITMGRKTANLDEAAALRNNVEIRPAIGGESGAGVAGPVELAWALILSLTRRVQEQDQAIRNGHWQTSLAGELRGKTLGLLGFGRVAQAMVPVGLAFGMRCIAYSPSLKADQVEPAGIEPVSRVRLFGASDVVSIHAALNPETTASIGRHEFRLMKRDAILINTARGAIVDEAALIGALQSGEIAGAGLDVFEAEPLPLRHPIRTVPNVVLSPHAGYVTAEGLATTYRGVAAQILTFAASRAD